MDHDNIEDDDYSEDLRWPNLKFLTVSNAGLEMCHSTFNHLRFLYHIDLHDNNLEYVPRLETPQLRILNLSKNQIRAALRLDHLAMWSARP